MKSIAALIIIIAILAVSCGNDKKEGAQNLTDSTSASQQGRIAARSLDLRSIPSACKFEGNFVKAVAWEDKNGDNTLIISESKADSLDGDVTLTKQKIYACLWIKSGFSTTRKWNYSDMAVNECDDGSGLVSEIEVTDVDGDGVAENAFVYNIAGNCDVSPIFYQMIMFSGSNYFETRGTNKVIYEDGTSYGGEVKFDPSFDSRPASFREFASGLWYKYVKEYKAF